ncbi:bucentaur or craniofacial development-domain-containing protein [Mycena floridula]|nr:bucentaur or craniofacial development-domain-containing protein [Mycena floridula]
MTNKAARKCLSLLFPSMTDPKREELESDSEDDGDYVPPVQEESEVSSDEEPDAKRARISPPPAPLDSEAEKKAREELWASFQSSVAWTSTTPGPPKKMVKIKKTYLFAGEPVTEVTEVPEDSADAKKWPLWTESATESPPVASESTVQGPEPSKASSSTLPAKRPGPRKSKVSLSDIPTTKPKKLSTLDKSAMDWRSHLAETDMKDELEANRRGGGYLEKVEFLNRVDDRKSSVFDANKSSKRRRG